MLDLKTSNSYGMYTRVINKWLVYYVEINLKSYIIFYMNLWFHYFLQNEEEFWNDFLWII